MSDVDLEVLAQHLARTAEGLTRHIAAEGRKVGDAHGVRYAKAAQDQIVEAQKDARRWKDLARELRRQMIPLERHDASWGVLRKAVRQSCLAAQERGEAAVPVAVLLEALAQAEEAGYKVAEEQGRREYAEGAGGV